MYNIGMLSNGRLAISYSTTYGNVCGSRYHMRVLSARNENAVFPKVHVSAVESGFFAAAFVLPSDLRGTQLVAYGSFSPAGRDILRPIVTRPRGENLDQSGKLEKHVGDAKIAQRPKPLSLLQRH